MLEIKNTVTEMKNASDELIYRVNAGEEIISEIEECINKQRIQQINGKEKETTFVHSWHDHLCRKFERTDRKISCS